MEVKTIVRKNSIPDVKISKEDKNQWKRGIFN